MSERFVKESVIAASAAIVFGFHERPGALVRLTPPWQRIEVIVPPASLAVGTRVVLRVKVGPLWREVVAEHVAYEPGHMFEDHMRKGPFARWEHRHVVTPRGPNESVLTDDVVYALPLGALGRAFGGAFARGAIAKLFEYRHAVTREDCERESRV